MLVVRRSALVCVIAWFLAAMIVSHGAAISQCPKDREGTIQLPAGKLPPPAVDDPDLHGILMFILLDPQPGNFELRPKHPTEPIFCLGGSACIAHRDFNVAFYQYSDLPVDTQVGTVYNGFGPVSGTVPANADYAMVWMTTGNDSWFVFEEKC